MTGGSSKIEDRDRRAVGGGEAGQLSRCRKPVGTAKRKGGRDEGCGRGE